MVGLGLLASCSGFTGSGESAKGLYKSRDAIGGTANGVRVVWDPLAKPDARVPFPNDLLTRFDPDSPSGLRLNFPLDATTELENDTRRGLNELTGFGTFAPLRVPFDGPIDVKTVRYKIEDPSNSNNTLFLIRIGGPNGPEPVPIDLGEGFFLYDAKGDPEVFWANDPLAKWPSFLLAPYNRALFNLGRQDPPALRETLLAGEVPELSPSVGDRHEYFEYSTNTLLFRPLEPLVPLSKYAVILTTRIADLDSNPIRSPFPYVNHALQNGDLRPVWEKLDRFGLARDEVAFMWSFTTHCPYCDLVDIRRGLDGEGPFAALRQKFPPRILNVYDLGVREPTNPRDVKLIGFTNREGLERDENPYTLHAAFLAGLINDVFNGALQSLVQGAIGGDVIPMDYQASFHNLNYVLFGSFISPSLVENERGVFTMDATTGRIDARMPEDPWDGDPGIPFLIAVPKPTRENKCGPPPYPVVIYGHGNTASSFTALFQANYLARYCIATAALDYYGHGPLFDLFRLFDKLPENPTLDDVLVTLEPFGVDAQQITETAGIDATQLVPTILAAARTIFSQSLFPMLDVPTEGREYRTLHDVSQSLEDVGLFKALLYYGRSHDTNGDGVRDQGDSFFDVNIMKTRDHFRQSAVDAMQFARVIKNLCRDHNGNGRLDLDEGNFDRDETPQPDGVIGTCDAGGPGHEIFYTSTSLGGIIGSLVTGADPLITRSALTVPGGGLADILARTTLGSVARRVYFGIVGTTVVGRPVEENGRGREGVIGLSVNDAGGKGATVKLRDLACEPREACLLPVQDGDTVLLVNLRSGEQRRVRAGPSDDPTSNFAAGGNFSMRVAADPGDTLLVTLPGGPDTPLAFPASVLPARACEYVTTQGGWPCAQFVVRKGQEGLGTDRNSPHLTFLIGIAETALESADPIAYAPLYNLRPLPDSPAKKVVIQVSTGDLTVPINAGVALGRAAGYVTHDAHVEYVRSGLTFGYSQRQQACMVLTPDVTCLPGSGDPASIARAPSLDQISWTAETAPNGRYISGFRPYNANQHAWYLLPIPFEDVGLDASPDFPNGTLNSREPGYNPFDNPDPSGDNYCPETNPTGPEGNRRLDGTEDQTVEDGHMRLNGILDVDYTQAAQQQAGILFRYGYIKEITPAQPDRMRCECIVNEATLEGFVTDSLEACTAAGGQLACITNPLCPGFGAPPWWP